jgi:outer membrane protein OmpA-like peptidoglycan-associated protein/outer membrane protein W
MRKLLSAVGLAALLAAMATNASATEGWYGRADVGYGFNGEVDASVSDSDEFCDDEICYDLDDSSATLELDNGWMAAIGAGYAFANGFRAEGELAYRSNDVSDAFSSASIDATSAMANLFYDFHREGEVQPYIGAGVGYASVEPEGTSSDSGLAWQALAGFSVPVRPQLSLDVGYRYFRVNDLDFSGISADYTHQAVTVGLRYQFAAPPPPPAPAPAPAPTPAPVAAPAPVVCPASHFVVYFEWDRSNLNQAALETIDAAAARARECNIGSAVVVGHTDTSGRPQYNDGLSQRRAAVVTDALVARGLPANLISSEGRGEGELARATADGVREPLNRRTAVSISFR